MHRQVHLSTYRPGRVVGLLLVALLGFPTSGLAAQQGPEAITCVACLVVDDTGRVLYERNAAVPRANASTTKMVTALLVRRHTSLDEEVTVSAAAAAAGAAQVRLPAGGGYTVEELLQALLMASSNEAAVALAEHVSGSEATFVRSMNRLAGRRGWDGTHFVTSHGLDRPGHLSTAADLAEIGDELLDDRVLARIVRTTETTISWDGGSISFANRNRLLESYGGSVGIKTGFTALAGNVLVAAAERSGRRVIAVAMGSVDSFSDSAALLDYGFARLRRTIVVRRDQVVAGLVFDQIGSTGVAPERPVRGLVDASQLEISFVPDPGVSLPIESGEGVGVLNIRDGSGETIARVGAVAQQDVAAPDSSIVQRAFAGLMRGAGSLFGEG